LVSSDRPGTVLITPPAHTQFQWYVVYSWPIVSLLILRLLHSPMAPHPVEQVFSRRDVAGVAVSPSSNSSNPYSSRPTLFPLGARCLQYALIDLRLGCVRYAWSRYRFTRTLERAWLTPRP